MKFVLALLLALSPVFITYSSLVMSDVPTLCVVLCALLALPDDGYWRARKLADAERRRIVAGSDVR